MTVTSLVERVNTAIDRMDSEKSSIIREGIRIESLPTIEQFIAHDLERSMAKDYPFNEVDTIMNILESYLHYADNQNEIRQ